MSEPRVSKALERLDQQGGKGGRREALTFEAYLELLLLKPRLVLRNIFQVFHDMVVSHVGDGVNEYPDDPESVGYLYYDTSPLLVEDVDSPFFADRLFANRLVRLVENMRRGSQQNKIYIFDGPPGSGKSTFLNNLLFKFEEYANTSEGMRHETLWRLDRRILGEGPAANPFLERLHCLLDGAMPDRDWRQELAFEPGEYDPGEGIEPDNGKPASMEPVQEVPCPSHDHPILMIPKKLRRQFFLDLFAGRRFLKELFSEKEYEWVFKGKPCTICMALHQALLEKTGSQRRVMEMLFARPYQCNRRLGEGISVFNPGDVTAKRPYFTNQPVQRSLNQLFVGGTQVQYAYSRYAKTHDGIYALMDIKSKNVERLVELHNIVSEGVHKVDNIEESVTSLFLALMNPEDKDNIKGVPSFSERVEYVNIPYVLDHNTEVKIFLSIFGPHIAQRFLPRVLHNFARAVISTRLNTQSEALKEWLNDTTRYGLYCDRDMLLLKMEIYAGRIPSWLSEQDVKLFTAKRRRRLLMEAEQEGRKGLSGRDSIKIFGEFYATYAKEDALINMAMLNHFFAKMRQDVAQFMPEGFLDALMSSYDYAVLQQVKEALFYFNKERISKDIQNYLFALSFEPGTTVTCEYTGERLVVSEEFFHGVEAKLLGGELDAERLKAFRRRTQKDFTSRALTQEILAEGKAITQTELYTTLYERYLHHIKAKVLDPFIANQNFRRAIKDFGTEEFKTYDHKIQNDVSFMMKNLQRRYNYSRQGAKETFIDLIDRGVAQKFAPAGQ